MPIFCRNCAHYSSARPPPNRSTKINDDQNNNKGSDTSDTSDFKPVNLSYRALECRGQERDCPSKSPLIIHHSLFGRKENWNPISEVIMTISRKFLQRPNFEFYFRSSIVSLKEKSSMSTLEIMAKVPIPQKCPYH